MDEREDQTPSNDIPVSAKIIKERSVRVWREQNTMKILIGALHSALETLAPKDRELVISYAEFESYAKLGEKVGRTRQSVKEYIDKLLCILRSRIEASF